jgi:hypothetical protein
MCQRYLVKISHERVKLCLFFFPILTLYPSILFNLIAPYHQILSLLLIGAILTLSYTKLYISKSMLCAFLLSAGYIIVHALMLDMETAKTSMSALLRVLFILAIYIAYQQLNKKQIIHSLINIIIIILFFNMLSFFFVLLFGLSPIYELTLHNGHTASLYFFSFSVVDMSFGSFRFLRGGGIFDEPGSLGFIAFLALVVNGIYNGEAKKSILICLLALFSFSMAFIILAVLYSFINVKLRKKTIPYTLGFMVLFSGLLASLPSDKLDIFHAYTIGRVLNFNSGDDSGAKSGNTRHHINKVSMELIEKAPFFGVGEKYALAYSNLFGTASIFAYIAIYGGIGYLLYIAPIIVMIFKIGTQSISQLRSLYLLSLCFLLFYQRPYWDLPLNFILMLMVFEGLNGKQRRKINGGR